MGRVILILYSLLTYAAFLAVFLYAVGFVTGLFVPKTIDSGREEPIAVALAIDLALLAVFALQHSVMARPAFKSWWTRFMPAPAERTTYVLFASLALALLCWQWRPIPAVVWQVEDPMMAQAVLALGLAGWLIVLGSTFLISHFELFGLSQAVRHFGGHGAAPAAFKTPGPYRFVRHPLYVGFIIAFWAAPVMTVGHLLFAAATTAYILIGIQLEERDLIALFGEDYRRYRTRVNMLLPWMRRSGP
ncbi:MAG: methanethiol S-methyltransferase [Rhodospirillaceae bacterium]